MSVNPCPIPTDPDRFRPILLDPDRRSCCRAAGGRIDRSESKTRTLGLISLESIRLNWIKPSPGSDRSRFNRNAARPIEFAWFWYDQPSPFNSAKFDPFQPPGEAVMERWTQSNRIVRQTRANSKQNKTNQPKIPAAINRNRINFIQIFLIAPRRTRPVMSGEKVVG